MLKYRLIFGTLMAMMFTGLLLLDGLLDGSLTASVTDDKKIQGTLLCVLVALLAWPAQREICKLFGGNGLKVFVPVTTAASIALGTGFYWKQFLGDAFGEYVLIVLALFVAGIFLSQYFHAGVSGTIGNCGASSLAALYLGVLSAMVVGIRVEFGVWPLLMFVSVVKSADIGAYTAGRIFGKHKFSPKISPKKTWEGMAGGVILASTVSMVFGQLCDIMCCTYAVLFGVAFAFIGQLGDLAESMMKRDAEQKDSATSVPGFGGLLDVLDSPLMAAPFAYIVFRMVIS